MNDMENHTNVELLVQKIKTLEHELESELVRRRTGLRYGIERGKVVFEQEVLRRHKELKVNLLAYIVKAQPLVALTAPFIYMLIVPLLLLDIFVSIYQAICFPVYKISKVKRGDYFVFDRSHLAYLNLLQKFNCAYCSYANGVIGYVREVGGRTEAYWCPIKHARRVIGSHEQYTEFANYGDAEAFQKIPSMQTNKEV